nr:MAG TPA: hypothetical protein [Bacteriophage sp.]DAR62888.1 MAG TPA: hypothetical protein [Caudoviricetes sp.]
MLILIMLYHMVYLTTETMKYVNSRELSLSSQVLRNQLIIRFYILIV